jgi:hypothetical protein
MEGYNSPLYRIWNRSKQVGNLKKANKLISWPRREYAWIEERTLFVSVPFTWNLPRVREMCEAPSIHWDQIIVGGPATFLLPEYLNGIKNLTIKKSMPGVLQRINPLATRTTLGCVRACKFCGVKKIEGKFRELPDWVNLPVLCDNNLLGSSKEHFDRVIERLIEHGWCDFNQGIDARLLTEYHAASIAKIKKPMVRLALDSLSYVSDWKRAVKYLKEAGISKSNIRTYVLIGFETKPSEAWDVCNFVKNEGISPNPMWFHPLDALEERAVTPRQKELGWTHDDRVSIMGYFYGGRGNDSRPYVQRQNARKGYWAFDGGGESGS